jgi:hypothetical protein
MDKTKCCYLIELPTSTGTIVELCKCDELAHALAIVEAIWRAGDYAPSWIKVTRVAIL